MAGHFNVSPSVLDGKDVDRSADYHGAQIFARGAGAGIDARIGAGDRGRHDAAAGGRRVLLCRPGRRLPGQIRDAHVAGAAEQLNLRPVGGIGRNRHLSAVAERAQHVAELVGLPVHLGGRGADCGRESLHRHSAAGRQRGSGFRRRRRHRRQRRQAAHIGKCADAAALNQRPSADNLDDIDLGAGRQSDRRAGCGWRLIGPGRGRDHALDRHGLHRIHIGHPRIAGVAPRLNPRDAAGVFQHGHHRVLAQRADPVGQRCV